jgi:hypothetical protein
VNGKPKKVKVCKTVKKPTPTPTPSPSQEATQLAQAVEHASSDSARVTALMNVMKALHIGVYDASTGAAIAGGTERSATDFYLYSFEITELSDAMARGEMRPIADEATLLTAVGIKPSGAAVDPEFLRKLAVDTVAGAVQHASDQGALLLLLLRALGQAHAQPYDLASDVPAASLQLDPLQFFLLTADILAPVVRAHAGATTFTSVMRPRVNIPCKAINVVTSPFNPNTYLDFGGQHVNYVVDAALASQISDFVQSLTEAEKTVGAVNLGFTVLSAIHGIILAYGIKIDAVSPLRQTTHYGPAGHFSADDGKPMTFTAQVKMQDDLGKNVVLCLGSAGFTIPPFGPIKDVGVSWHSDGPGLSDYGTLDYSPAENGVLSTADQTTGADGTVTVTYTPKDELVPGVGTVETATGGVEARALWGMAFENLLGTINQLITPKLSPEMFWTVTYHKARGYMFAVSESWDGVPNPNYNPGGPPAGDGGCDPGSCHGALVKTHEDWTYTGSVCGEDPYNRSSTPGYLGAHWKVDYRVQFQFIYQDGYIRSETETGTESWALLPNGQYSGGSLYAGRKSAQFTPGANGAAPKVSFFDTHQDDYWAWTPGSQTKTSTVTEDTTCPAP